MSGHGRASRTRQPRVTCTEGACGHSRSLSDSLLSANCAVPRDRSDTVTLGCVVAAVEVLETTWYNRSSGKEHAGCLDLCGGAGGKGIGRTSRTGLVSLPGPIRGDRQLRVYFPGLETPVVGRDRTQAPKGDRMDTGVAVKSRYPEERSLTDDLGNWWVLHTRPNCEKTMATYLLNRNISYYLPLFQQQKTFGNLRRVRISEIPLFNGYICFALDKKQHHLLFDTKKFVRIIKVDDQDLFVRELSGISKAVENESALLVRRGLVPGRKVRILSGPFTGNEGVVVGSRNDKRFALSVQIFNQSVLVRLDPLTNLEPI